MHVSDLSLLKDNKTLDSMQQHLSRRVDNICGTYRKPRYSMYEDTLLQLYYHIHCLLEGTYTLRILENAWELILKIGPYLLASIVVSVVVTRIFRKRPLRFSSQSEALSIITAALLGLFSPLPTYAAIPVSLSLTASGVPFSAVIAFVIASPLMNPGIFLLTASELGMGMAIARTMAAFIAGLAGGLLIATVLRSLSLPAGRVPAPPPPSDKPVLTDLWRTSRYTAKYFSVAILLSAAVKALVPPQAVADLLGDHARMGTLAAIALGVPFYSCGGAAIPFVETLRDLGMSKGAMLAFFVAGPATKLETLYAFKAMLGPKVLLFYIALTLGCAVGAGVVYGLM
jgi:uncharacterized protein